MNNTIRKKISNSGKEICPICNNAEILVEHHINGRKIPDFDASWNKCYICSNCHNKIHRDLIKIEGWFKTSSGLELIWEYIKG